MKRWQPIDSAPHDQVVLLWDEPTKQMNMGMFNDSYTKKWHGVVNGEEASWNDWDSPPIFDATHWMPLPEPPQEKTT